MTGHRRKNGKIEVDEEVERASIKAIRKAINPMLEVLFVNAGKSYSQLPLLLLHPLLILLLPLVPDVTA